MVVCVNYKTINSISMGLGQLSIPVEFLVKNDEYIFIVKTPKGRKLGEVVLQDGKFEGELNCTKAYAREICEVIRVFVLHTISTHISNSEGVKKVKINGTIKGETNVEIGCKSVAKVCKDAIL